MEWSSESQPEELECWQRECRQRVVIVVVLERNTNEFTLVAVLYNYLDLKIELQIIILTFYYINEQ